VQGAVRLIAAMARPRCLIVVDDLQWADPASLTLLGLLLRRLDGVSLAAAYRADGTAGVDPAEALGVPAAQMTRITLGPLPAGAIRNLFGDQLLARAILRQAGRTPFTVTEVIAALARQGAITRDGDSKWRLRPGRDAAGAASIVAAGIGQAAGNRLAGLPSRYRDMLGLLALLDRPASAPLLAAASGTGLHSALDTLGGLAAPGWPAQARGAGHRHELVRQAVTATMRPAETARCHALLGRRWRNPALTRPRPAATWPPAATTTAPPWRTRPPHAASWTGSATARPCGWPGPACRLTRPPHPGGAAGGARGGPPPRRPAGRGPR